MIFFFPNNYIFLDCKKQKNELICPITKDKFIENLENSDITLNGGNIQYLDNKYDMARNRFPMISQINLVYENSTKEDIYVGITKCLTNYTEFKAKHMLPMKQMLLILKKLKLIYLFLLKAKIQK